MKLKRRGIFITVYACTVNTNANVLQILHEHALKRISLSRSHKHGSLLPEMLNI